MTQKTLTTTGWEKRITQYCFDHGIERSKGQIQRMAIKIAKRFQFMTGMRYASEAEQFEIGLRILGLHSDTTARDAVKNIEKQAA